MALAIRHVAPPSSGLTALLDALEQDLLAAPVVEVLDAQRETGRARRAACQEVRSLLNEAVAASEDSSAVAAPPDVHAGRGLHQH